MSGWHSERIRLNRLLLLGAINHLIFLSVNLFAYVSSGFKTSGDTYGGLMMVYAFSLFMPQFVFGVAVLLIISANLYKNRLTGTSKKYAAAYFVTLFFVLPSWLVA